MVLCFLQWLHLVVHECRQRLVGLALNSHVHGRVPSLAGRPAYGARRRAAGCWSPRGAEKNPIFGS